jgi:hypothetical protein
MKWCCFFFGTGKFYAPTHTFHFTHKECIVVMPLARAPQPKPFVAVKGGEKRKQQKQQVQQVQHVQVQEQQEEQEEQEQQEQVPHVHPHVAWS